MLGPNGAGKTTLLRILATLLRPTRRRGRGARRELPREAWKLRGRIGYLGHEPLLYRDLSGAREPRLPRPPARDRRRRRRARIDELLDARRARPPRRRAGRRDLGRDAPAARRSAAALLHEPELLLLDEPLANLDPAGAEVVAPLLGPAPGRTRVIVTHDVEPRSSEADRVLGLRARRQRRLRDRGRGGRSGDRSRDLLGAGGGRPMSGRAPSTGKVVRAILGKDLRVELRTLQSVPAMAAVRDDDLRALPLRARPDRLAAASPPGSCW